MIYERKPNLTNQERSDMAVCAMAMEKYLKELDYQVSTKNVIRKLVAILFGSLAVIAGLCILYNLANFFLR